MARRVAEIFPLPWDTRQMPSQLGRWPHRATCSNWGLLFNVSLHKLCHFLLESNLRAHGIFSPTPKTICPTVSPILLFLPFNQQALMFMERRYDSIQVSERNTA